MLEKDFRVEADLERQADEREDSRRGRSRRCPYILVIGDKEMAANAVAVRLRGGEDLGAKPVAEFVAMLEQVVRSRTLKLVP